MAATTRRRRRLENKPTQPRGDFSFTTKDGVTITVPPFSTLKPGFIRKIRKLDQADQFFTMLEEVLDIRWQDQIDEIRENVIAAREAGGESDVEVTDREVEKQMDPDPTLDVIDNLDHEEFQDFQAGWFEHSGVDLGE